ncbi:hypothetical protein FRX31_033911 [Thalictrum thalictroides]|uniref:LOB domain-containing protein n=1 Tax=Thalictrum thalictroides TaxID=46969 RepID=A0A7J6UVL1_THATH|nr:hypothetical protein FRX31_033911 [Thalictrum thalictroides]
MSAFGIGNGNGAVNCEYNHDCVTCRTSRRECNGCFFQNYYFLYHLGDYLLVTHTYDPVNLMSMLRSVPPSWRQAAANSLATEATIRHVDPVGGCLGFIQYLEADIKHHEEMLRDVRKQLAEAKGEQPEEDPTPTLPATCYLHQGQSPVNPSTDGGRICDICGQGICEILDPKISSRATAPADSEDSLGTEDEEGTEEDYDADYDEEGTEEDTDADLEDPYDNVYFL